MKKNNTRVKEFFIFNRDATCIYHIDLQENVVINKAVNVVTDKKLEFKYKDIYGLLFSMRNFMKKFSTNKESTHRDNFKSFSTSQYKLHYLELINGLRLIILSSPTKADYSGFLKEIYKKYYCNLISSNLFFDKNSYINNSLFNELLINYLNEIVV